MEEVPVVAVSRADKLESREPFTPDNLWCILKERGGAGGVGGGGGDV